MSTDMKEVQANLEIYLSWVEQGEEIAITRSGKVVARLVPPEPFEGLDPDLMAERRNRLDSPEDMPNLVIDFLRKYQLSNGVGDSHRKHLDLCKRSTLSS